MAGKLDHAPDCNQVIANRPWQVARQGHEYQSTPGCTAPSAIPACNQYPLAVAKLCDDWVDHTFDRFPWPVACNHPSSIILPKVFDPGILGHGRATGSWQCAIYAVLLHETGILASVHATTPTLSACGRMAPNQMHRMPLWRTQTIELRDPETPPKILNRRLEKQQEKSLMKLPPVVGILCHLC